MAKIIIVGGGIAGLSAGIYARQSGFTTLVLEQHTIPGGNCTSWKRNGYFFEGGMHWLTGSSPKAPIHTLWREVGALDDTVSVYNRDPFVTWDDGTQQICVYRDPKKLRKHLLSVSPEDASAINRLCKDIRSFGGFMMPVMDIKGVRVKKQKSPPLGMLFKLVAAAGRFKALSGMSVAEYVSGFRHEGIRTLFSNLIGDTSFSAMSLAATLGGLASGDGGYPAGGSLGMARRMAKTYAALGGEIQYSIHVDHVRVENGQATGVLANGQAMEADAVIVTADTLAAADALFTPPLQEPWAKELRAQVIPLCCTFIGLGIEADLSALPENLYFPVEPFEYAGGTISMLGMNNYSTFEGYAPPGCTAATLVLMGDSYSYWKQAKEDGSYEQKKQQLANIVAERLGKAYPQTAGKIAASDVATPLTYERYCGTFHGSWMSVLPTGNVRQMYPQKSEETGGLYFAGQRTMLPGGLPVALATGRSAAQYLCRDYDVVFQGSV